MKKVLTSNWQAATIFAIFLITFVTFNILFDASSQAGYFKEILAALIGTILAAVVTTLLLKSQTRGQELKEKTVEVFRSKLRVYDEFISQAVDSINDEKLEVEEVRKLKKLGYQIALVSSDATVKAVTGFIRSYFVAKDNTIRMPEVVNALRLDLALEGVTALDSGDLEVIETTLRDPAAFKADTADQRLAIVRDGLIKHSKGRYDVSEIESDVFNSPEGRAFQLIFKGGELNLDADFSADPDAPIFAYILFDKVPTARQTRFAKQAFAMGFLPSDPEGGMVEPEAHVIMKEDKGVARPPGSLTIEELSDAVAKLAKI